MRYSKEECGFDHSSIDNLLKLCAVMSRLQSDLHIPQILLALIIYKILWLTLKFGPFLKLTNFCSS